MIKNFNLKKNILSYLFILFLSLTIALSYFFIDLKKNRISRNKPDILGKEINLQTQLSATIGKIGKLTIFGYTSPNSLVKLEGEAVLEETYSENSGYFIFNKIAIPLNKSLQLCLYSQDQFGRITKPVCLPKIDENTKGNIGPILLPPTLSLNKSFFFPDEKIIFSGQSLPNSKINLYFFKEKNIIDPAFPKKTFAAAPRTTETKTDKKGNFTFILQVSHAQKLNVFASTDFQNSPSPQSLKLKVKVYPLWMLIVIFVKNILAAAKKYILEIILLFELSIVLWIGYKKLLSPSQIAKTRAIVKYKSLLPLKISS